MIRNWVLFTLLILAAYGQAQWIPPVLDLDTVRFSFRTGGELDTVDRIAQRNSSTLPGGGLEMPLGLPTIDFFKNYIGLNRFQKVSIDRTVRYSGLPHIGFSYLFGTQGTQMTRLNYQQVFGKKVLVNFDIHNDRSNNFLRFGNHVFNDIDLDVLKKGQLWSSRLVFSDVKHESVLNGGLLSESDPNEFPLIFLGVNKRNASSTFRDTRIRWDNYFDFNSDSLRSIGVTTSHSLNIRQRIYTETDTLFGIYNLVNYDSLETKDRYQLSETDHALGFFHGSPKHYFSARIHQKYWKYYHLGTDTDTLETAIRSDFSLKMRNLRFVGEAYANLVGAGNEWSTTFQVLGSKGKLGYRASVSSSRLWPVQFQRIYFANNFSYALNDYDLQGRTAINADLSYKIQDWMIFGNLDFVSLKDNYLFDPVVGSWSNDLYPDLLLSSISLKTQWRRKGFSMLSSYVYTLEGQDLNFVPDHVFSLRSQLQGTLFKSRKLQVYIGGEFLANSKVDALAFIPAMDSYVMGSSAFTFNGLINAHVFGGFQIDEFRMFVRYENLGYLWNDRAQFPVVGYPIPAGMLRLGITWDFFN